MRGVVGRREEAPARAKIHANRDRLAEQRVAAKIETIPEGLKRPVMDRAAEARLDEVAV